MIDTLFSKRDERMLVFKISLFLQQVRLRIREERVYFFGWQKKGLSNGGEISLPGCRKTLMEDG